MARRKTSETEPPAEPVGAPVATDPVEPLAAADAAPEPESALPPHIALPPTDPPVPRRSGVLGPLLGVALAAVAGFGLSHFNLFGLSAPDQGGALSALEQRLSEGLAGVEAEKAAVASLRADLAMLTGRMDALEAAPAPETPDVSGLDALDALDRRLSAIEALPAGEAASTAALAARLAELERQVADGPPAVDQTRIDAALARLDAAEAEAAQRADDAAAATAAAARAAALDALRAAVTAGAGFEAELAAVDDPALTAALQHHAGGVATLASLQADFPAPARQALRLARDASGGGSWGERLTDFLAAQTGARSLTPREGDDADAILSRAEFALSEGRLAEALAELRALDAPLRAPFAGWIARAEARLAVDTALEGL